MQQKTKDYTFFLTLTGHAEVTVQATSLAHANQLFEEEMYQRSIVDEIVFDREITYVEYEGEDS